MAQVQGTGKVGETVSKTTKTRIRYMEKEEASKEKGVKKRPEKNKKEAKKMQEGITYAAGGGDL